MRLFILSTLLLLSTQLWAQTTHYVSMTGTCSGGTPCYSTVQDAVDAASPGDIISVEKGEYIEDVMINKSLTIKGAEAGKVAYSRNDFIFDYFITGGAPVYNESIINGKMTIDNAENVTLDGLVMCLPVVDQILTVKNSKKIKLLNNFYTTSVYGNLPKAILIEDCEDITIKDSFFTILELGVVLKNTLKVDIIHNMFGTRGQNIPMGKEHYYSMRHPFQILENCGNITIFENELDKVNSIMRLYISDLRGFLLLKGNLFDNAGNDAGGIVLDDAHCEINNNYLTLIENFFTNNFGCIYTGGVHKPSTGIINANANYWSNGLAPNMALTNQCVTGKNRDQVIAKVNIYNPDRSNTSYFDRRDKDPKVGYQSSRIVGFVKNTLIHANVRATTQEAIDATPLPENGDMSKRWTLEIGIQKQDKVTKSAIVVDKPMILASYRDRRTPPSLTHRGIIKPASPADQAIIIKSDNVIIDSLDVVINSNCPVGILDEGHNNIEIDGVSFEAAPGLTSFQDLVIDTKNSTKDNTIVIENCTFGGSDVSGGTGIFFKDTQAGVTYSTLKAEHNTFMGNLEYFIRLDATAGAEFHTDFNITTNKFEVGSPFVAKSINDMTESDLFEVEDKILHGVDVPKVVMLTLKKNHFYITPDSYFAPITTEPNLNRVIDKSVPNDTIHIKSGTYPSDLNIQKPLTFDVQMDTVVSNPKVKSLVVNIPNGDLVIDNDFTILNSLSLTKGHIDNTAAGAIYYAPTFTTRNGGSKYSFIKGAAGKDNTGLTTPINETFPIGSGTDDYRPVQIKGMTGTDLKVSIATYKPRSGNNAIDSIGCIEGFPRVWNLKHNKGTFTNNGEIKLNYDTGDGVNHTKIPSRLLVGMAPADSGLYKPITNVVDAISINKGSITAKVKAPKAYGPNNYLTLGVKRPPAPPLTISGNTIVCDGQTTTLSIQNPDPTFNYTWFNESNVKLGDGTSIDLASTTIGAVGDSIIVRAHYLDPVINCLSGNKEITIKVVPQPNADFDYTVNTFCGSSSSTNPSANIVDPNAVGSGKFTATPTGLVFVNDVTGEIDLKNTKPGKYTIKFEIGGGRSGCKLVTKEKEISISKPAASEITVDAEPYKGVIYYCENSITLTAEDGISYNYQWKKDGVAIAGATNRTLDATDDGEYIVTIDNVCGTYDSKPIKIKKTTAPKFTIQSEGAVIEDLSLGLGETRELTVDLQNPLGNETYLWSPEEGISDPTSPNPTLTAYDNITYTVAVSSSLNCTTEKQLVLKTNKDLFIPNAFFPNSDNDNNNVFKIFGSGLKDIKLLVLDRIGKIVYETSNIDEATTQGWNGKVNGKLLPQGTYTWRLHGTKVNGDKVLYKGKNYGTINLVW